MSNGWTEPDSVGTYLADALPDEYFVLAEPTVHGQALDAVIVGPQGLFVLYARGWEGEVRPARYGPWRGQLASGREVRYPNPVQEMRQARDALSAFLRDEFPSLDPTVWHLLVLMSPDVKVTGSEAAEPRAMTAEAAAEEITSTEPPPGEAALDSESREELALALRHRKLTASQRASEPFVFRSGGLFGSGKKVWTVRAAVRHMDRHPADGIYHLRNGTLGQWLSAQGAEHLAQSAREVMSQGGANPRIALESFLIGTGLVDRPRLSVQPRQLNLGFILSGETSATRLRVRKGRGRGYLFGSLQASDPWLDVEPRTVRGRPLESVVTVTARTDSLLISPTPYEAEIYVESNASEEPVAVPVRFRIVGLPARLNRYVLRPLAGLLSAGLLGAAVGWSLGRWGIPAPAWLAGLTSPPMSSAAVWTALIGVVWAVLGGIRGALQRFAWPTSYALGRWLVRTLAWGAALPLVAAAGLWCWRQLDPEPAIAIARTTPGAIPLFALAGAILPAVLGDIRPIRPGKRTPVTSAGRSLRRPMLVAAIGVALALLVAVSAPVLGLIGQRVDLQKTVASVQEWAGDQLIQLETGVDHLTDRLYLRYHDRRAPVQPTPAAPVPTPPLTPEGGRP